HSLFMQRLYRNRDYAQSFSWLAKIPTGDGDPAARFQMIEVFSKCLHRIKTVFTEGEGSGGGGSPGVDQSHLDHVKILLRIANKRSPVGNLDVYLGPLIQVIRIIGVAVAHHGVGDDRIDLNSGDARAAVGNGAKYIDSATRADDCVLAVRPQNISQCRR